MGVGGWSTPVPSGSATAYIGKMVIGLASTHNTCILVTLYDALYANKRSSASKIPCGEKHAHQSSSLRLGMYAHWSR